MSDRVGQQFGNYRLIKLLGQGGFAEVYLGEHCLLGSQSAIKVLHTHLVTAEEKHFLAEARTIAHLEHPHIIRILEFDVSEGTPFLVMSYAPNGNLRQRHPKGSQLPLQQILNYVQQIVDALQYAHDENFIHRDIKPANMLLGKRNELLLSDFGIALVAQSSRYQSTQGVIGTASYMSPEQIQGKPRPVSDQYSLGVVIYEWISGTLPFEGSLTELWSQHIYAPPPPLREKVSTIPPEVERVLMIALAKDPKQRFDSMRTFATALQQAIQVGTAIPLRLSIGNTLPVSPLSQTLPITSPYAQTNTALSARSSGDTKPQGSLKWAFKASGPITSSPVVTNGIVYFGSHDGKFYALDASSGQKKWSFTCGMAVQSSPTVVNNIVYFGSRDGKLYALHASSGRKKWSFQAEGEILSSPAVDNGIVYFISQRKIYALYTFLGWKKWSFPIRGDTLPSSPTVANGVLYFDAGHWAIRAVHAAAGPKLGSRDFFKKEYFNKHSEASSSLTVVNNILYFGGGRNFKALDATNGKYMWSFDTDVAVKSSPTVDNGIVYFGSDNGKFYALHAASGQQMWSFQTGEQSPAKKRSSDRYGAYSSRQDNTTLNRQILSSPAVVNGTVYFGSNDGNLYALDASSGQKKWSFQTGDMVQSSPAVDDGIVYFGSYDHNLYAIFT
jgi:outer membrane protein assembly factor BamB